MWSAWVDIARQRLGAGDMDGAVFAAGLANEGDGAPCPFAEPELARGYHAMDDLRSRVEQCRRPAVADDWRPRAGRTQAAHTAEPGREFDL